MAWARLGTADVHALTFDASDADRLLFGHHDGLLATTDGGRSWQPTALTGSDAMNVARLSDERLQIAGHEVYLESTDGRATWAPVPNDLPRALTCTPSRSIRTTRTARGPSPSATVCSGPTMPAATGSNWTRTTGAP